MGTGGEESGEGGVEKRMCDVAGAAEGYCLSTTFAAKCADTWPIFSQQRTARQDQHAY